MITFLDTLGCNVGREEVAKLRPPYSKLQFATIYVYRRGFFTRSVGIDFRDQSDDAPEIVIKTNEKAAVEVT